MKLLTQGKNMWSEKAISILNTTENETDTTTEWNTERNVQEYTTYWIVLHVMSEDGLRIILRWYWYSALDDTEDPTQDIPKHLIDRYY